MKVLLYGSKGWIGNKVCKLIENDKNMILIKGKSRVDDEIRLLEEINSIKPERIISLIGRTSGKDIQTIDYLEHGNDKLIENIRDNLYAPLTLAIICKQYKIHLTYLGTGCIFNYDEKHKMYSEVGYKESDLPNFFGSKYSIVKGFTDRLMHQFDDCVLNLRIRMPIDNEDHPKNLISKLLKYEKICNMPNSMSVLGDVLPIMILMIKDKLTGTVNLTNPGYITHNAILNRYIEIVDPTFKYKNFSIKEQNKILKSKRSNNYLSTDTINNSYPIPEIHKSVTNVLKNWKV